ncbi:hypothetical protein PMZ80_011246 [Knufia obscura]|uniref:Uncharacterized protein n=2 Tax=Trichomeriaceae TaxID=1233474 RepID=A0ABR0JUK5_9EURO|nr:hypothetical protein LTR24_010236 [Lithohypha guttulata]KAK5078755.1 hypothetical protein LTR51_000946 [Lithohypha guttulata]KAK5097834.1 hypothetical protein LTS08_006589 [Lithohypha guttulata]KAK5313845.1 hypothetical protein LTR70_007419 [Exophiala xenobiotica]KAK5936519.1 hypothetical protein PMZ80_011246 [Knufia obscura]
MKDSVQHNALIEDGGCPYQPEVIDLTQSDDDSAFEGDTESDDDLPSLRSIMLGRNKKRNITKSRDVEDSVSDKVIDFARNGGTVVLGGLFSSLIRPNDLRTYFSSKWALP